MNELKFYRCNDCGNFAAMMTNGEGTMTCCNEAMQELIPNTTDASNEKHLPAVTIVGDSVSVNIGSIDHPMLPEHHIEFIYLKTTNGGQYKKLGMTDKPHADFELVDDTVEAVYEYCNLHGLWKVDVDPEDAIEMVCAAEFSEGCI